MECNRKIERKDAMADETTQFLLGPATHFDEPGSRRASPRASRAFTLNYDTAVYPSSSPSPSPLSSD